MGRWFPWAWPNYRRSFKSSGFSGWLQKRRDSEIGSTWEIQRGKVLYCWLCRWKEPREKDYAQSPEAGAAPGQQPGRKQWPCSTATGNWILPTTWMRLEHVLSQSLQMRGEKLESKQTGSRWSPLKHLRGPPVVLSHCCGCRCGVAIPHNQHASEVWVADSRSGLESMLSLLDGLGLPFFIYIPYGFDYKEWLRVGKETTIGKRLLLFMFSLCNLTDTSFLYYELFSFLSFWF